MSKTNNTSGSKSNASIDVRFRANKYELDIYAILESIPNDIKNEFLKECIVEQVKAVVNGEKKSRILSRQALCNELSDKQAELSFYIPNKEMILSEMEREYLSPKHSNKEIVYISTEKEIQPKAENNTSIDNTDINTESNIESNTQSNSFTTEENIVTTYDSDIDDDNSNDNNDDDDNDIDYDDYNDSSNGGMFGGQGQSIWD